MTRAVRQRTLSLPGSEEFVVLLERHRFSQRACEVLFPRLNANRVTMEALATCREAKASLTQTHMAQGDSSES